MPGDTKQYDPKSVVVVFGFVSFHGFADGSMIEVERNEDSFTLKVGADGEGTRVRNANRSGKFTVKLMQSSATNAELSALLAADELASNGASMLPFMVKDNSGYSLSWAEKAWIVKPPKPSYGKEVTEREWVFEATHINIVEGGN